VMKPSGPRFRRVLWLGTSGAAVAALVVAGVTSSVAAQRTSLAGTSLRGPGYPPPRGMYAPFTNCPLKNPLMHESNDFTACTGGNATSGSITIGNITTPVVQPVNVQFGFFIPPRDANFYPAPAMPPLAGPSAILATKPDPIPETLTQALGCPSSDATVEKICQQAQTLGGNYNTVSALAQEAGPITNFSLFSWTQPLKFKLINPLLGGNCYIGSDETPIVVNPSLSVGSGGGLFEENDPAPTVHPDTFVLGARRYRLRPRRSRQRRGRRGARHLERPARGLRKQPHSQRQLPRRCQWRVRGLVANPAAGRCRRPAGSVQGQHEW